MALSTTAVMLGGPTHGHRFALPTRASTWNVVQQAHVTDWLREGKTLRWSLPTMDYVRADVIEVPVGCHMARAVVWPDVKPETAKVVLADYIMAAWEGYDITHGAQRR